MKINNIGLVFCLAGIFLSCATVSASEMPGRHNTNFELKQVAAEMRMEMEDVALTELENNIEAPEVDLPRALIADELPQMPSSPQQPELTSAIATY